MAWPTTSDPRTEFVTLRFTKSEAADIDWLQQITRGKNRSDTLRRCVDRVVAAEKRRAARNRPSEAAPGAGMVAEGD